MTSNLLKTLRRAENNSIFWTDVPKKLKKSTQEATHKLDYNVGNIAEQTKDSTLEICDVDHKKVFIKSALKCALSKLLLSILDDSLGIKESFQNAIFSVATTSKSITVVALAVGRNNKAVESTARYVAEVFNEEMVESVKDLLSTLPPHSQSGSDSSSDKAQKSSDDRKSKKNLTTANRACCHLSKVTGP